MREKRKNKKKCREIGESQARVEKERKKQKRQLSEKKRVESQ